MNAKSGLSLIEVMIGTVILSGLALAVYGLMAGSADTYAAGSARQTLEDNARRALDQIAQDLRDADRASFFPAAGATSTYLSFRKTTSFDPSSKAAVWSQEIGYSNVAGLANPATKSVEGRLVRTGPNAAGKSETLTISEFLSPASSPTPGLQVTRTGDRVTITVTLRAFDRKLRAMTASLSTTITLRNQS